MPRNPKRPRILRGVEVCNKMLPCIRCKDDKPVEEFRIRTDKKKGLKYYNSNCIACDNEVAKEYYLKVKDNPEFKEKNRRRQKEYADKNIDQIKERRQTTEYRAKHLKWEKGRYKRKRDEINAKMKIKRQTPEYKAMMKAYRQRNKEKIHQQEVITKQRYHEKNKKPITDKYVSNLLRTQGIKITPENIEIKRGQILISRIKDKVLKATKNNKK